LETTALKQQLIASIGEYNSAPPSGQASQAAAADGQDGHNSKPDMDAEKLHSFTSPNAQSAPNSYSPHSQTAAVLLSDELRQYLHIEQDPPSNTTPRWPYSNLQNVITRYL